VFCVVEKFSGAETRKPSSAGVTPLPAQNPGTGDD
jgi:hypothetical protein